ncbi:hypothetical protein Goklo_018024 [Gossypium klotzschianum]|uniref:Carotenoid cleavage dioxygenase 4 n=1 Tax=Gossypium klotzschianum TaxID=34286 RepID=A0A7J8UJK2_9ROSI|nr:hypothetical protein [Gossypium klotzschianum]
MWETFKIDVTVVDICHENCHVAITIDIPCFSVFTRKTKINHAKTEMISSTCSPILSFTQPKAVMMIQAVRNPKALEKTTSLKMHSSPLKSMKTSILHFFSNFIDPPLNPSVDPTHVFEGNLAPVDEMEPTDCEVIEGELPLCLNGVYIRNGPNPQLQPCRALNLFEGDGMLHSLRLSNGKATYCNRYVKTYKYLVEKEVGFPIFPNMLSGLYGLLDVARLSIFIKRLVTGNLDILEGIGVANTSVAVVSGKLLALCESDLPYIVNVTQNGDIETLGRWEVDKNLHSNMTAHPKVDSETKETFAYSWSFKTPHLTFFRIDEKGVKQNEVPIFSVHRPSIIHDFAITKRFAIFHETQLSFSLSKVLTGRGSPLVYEPDKTTRIGTIPRYANSDSKMKWFEVPRFNASHIVNAWENGEDEIIVVASNILSLENFLDSMKLDVVLEKVKINTQTGNVCRNLLSTRKLDLGSINTSYMGKKTRYAYLGVIEETPKMSGLVKIDLETGDEVGRRFYRDDCFGGEPLFVRRNVGDDEDDGFVMTFVHNERTDESMFLLMDPKSPDFATIAAVKLPRRVPYGFHSLFFTNSKIPI